MTAVPPVSASSAYQISSPEPFQFSRPDDWPKWKRRFERFRIASGLTKSPEVEQVNTLLYLMGDQADDILLSFNLTEEESKVYNNVITLFDKHFIPKRNVIYERTKFNRRVQNPGEPIEEFVTSLYSLAEHCKYGALHDEMLRDRIVVGVLDRRLSERLQLDENLMLEKAITSARQSEDVKKQQLVLNPDEKQGVDRIHVNKLNNKKTKTKFVHNKMATGSDKSVTLSRGSKNCCSWCGRTPVHARQECPAKNSKCHKCEKKGHFQNVCKGVGSVQNIEFDSEGADAFLGAIKNVNYVSAKWIVPIIMEGVDHPINFKVDSGADVTVMPDSYKSYFQAKKTNRRLHGPGKNTLEVTGMININIKYKDRHCIENIYFIKNFPTPLLGLPAIEKLNVLKFVNSIQGESIDIKREFPELFQGLGQIQGEYKISLQEGAEPRAISSPRVVPIPLMKSVEEELKLMVKQGVISPVDEPTEWCAPIVIVPKAKGIRICVDFTHLNKSVRRESHPIPKIENTLGRLGGAKFFSKLDANSGFFQVPLAEESKHLTTFITPFGRFCFNRLPFGITSAPEHFQKRMSQGLEGCESVVCHMDDILIWGDTKEKHDLCLRKVLNRLKDIGMTLNWEKTKIFQTSIQFLGHIIDQEGVRPDNEKIDAISKMEAPINKTELQRFLGMVNFVGRCIPLKSDLLEPLNILLRDDYEFVWEKPQQQVFEKIKSILAAKPILVIFDPAKKTKISADASSYGIGGVLLQQQGDGQMRPVAYVSRTLSVSERRYAQIEREALAITWTCDKLKDYITGLHFQIETDHKPLVPIFTTKNLDDLSPRLQRFKIRLMRYSFDICHIPGKMMFAADALSRKPIPSMEKEELEAETNAYVHLIMENLPATDVRKAQIIKEQGLDRACSIIKTYVHQGWPQKGELDTLVLPYWSERENITEQEGLLMKSCRLMIPDRLRKEILDKLHEGHQGITKCRARARQSVWWPGLSKEMEDYIRRCPECVQFSSNRHEPLNPSPFPHRPWQRVGLDILKCTGKWYLVISDYYSRYMELAYLESLKSTCVIEKVKSVFARHGIPEEVRSDNGPQFQVLQSSEFHKFSVDYGFTHTTSSPYFPQSNGFAEAAVKIVKKRLQKSEDPYKALLAYRATPLENGFSPAELLMNRRLRTTVPIAEKMLESSVPDQVKIHTSEQVRKDKQVKSYNKHHGVRDLPDLKEGSMVWIKDMKTHGRIEGKAKTPRSYIIKTDQGKIRRNRWSLLQAPYQKDLNGSTNDHSIDSEEPQESKTICEEQRSLTQEKVASPPKIPYHTRSGRTVKKPDRLDL